ncbi:YlxR family protein [Ammonicoccus fulvus]|uniref:YlxR family protein n=1 Tax=Ammonicoccus fulvus TaxID=3138240 RepID=A0ABZ3FRH2_9ACTN
MTPERTCVGCRATAPQDQLVRVALDSSGLVVVVDEQRRTPGRGAYVHRDPRCITQAVKRNAAQRALRAPRADVSALSALGSALSAEEAALCEKGSGGVE